MRDLRKRVAKLESAIRTPEHRKVRQFAIEGPKNLPEGAAEAFLRECGHDILDEDRNIIRVMVSAHRDLPLRDITPRCGR